LIRAGVTPQVRSVEFFGLPGSGKTTVANALVSLLQARGADASFSGERMGDGASIARRTLRRLALVVGQLPQAIGSYYRGTRLVVSRSRGWGDSVHSVWNLISVQAMVGQHLRGHGLMVLDQGLVQAIWSAKMREICGDGDVGWDALLNDAWVDQCCFVQVECEIETALGRLSERQQRTSRMQRADRLREGPLWSRGRVLVTQLGTMTEELLRHRSLTNRLIRIRTDNGLSPPALAEAVLEKLLNAALITTAT
jgi:RecA/RadA recombinase